MTSNSRKPRSSGRSRRTGKSAPSSLRRTIDRLYADIGRSAAPPAAYGDIDLPAPVIHITEDDAAYRLMADLPGLDLADLDIIADSGTLTIIGERTFSQSDDDGGSHLMETVCEQFEHCFHLPETVDSAAITAEMTGSVLTVLVPKASPRLRGRSARIRPAV
jgi:HSP20 family protein